MRINDLLVETKRKSSAVKLQSAWEKQQAKSTASRKRGEEYMAKIKQDVAKKEQGVAEGLSDTQKKIEDTILKLEQRLKFAKTPEQWDNIKNRIERLQAGLTRSKTGVAEAFDNPYKGKWEKIDDYSDSVDMSVKLPDGTNLSIMFNQDYGDEGEEIIQVEFYRNNRQDVTGGGDAQRIFATVLDAIQKYIKKYKPQKLSFSASKAVDMDTDDNGAQVNPESRAKLYDRLVQRYSKALGYRAFRADNGDIVIYELSRIKQGVAENYYSDLMKQTYAKFFKPAPPKTVSAVKKFLSGVIISLGTAQDNDYDEEEPEEISWEQDLADVREAYSKLRGNSSPNWFDIADAVLSYDTEFRESMLEWAEEELGNELVDFLWHEVWEAKNQISRSSGSYNVTLGHQSVPGQKNDRDSFKDWDPETDPPNPFANLRWLVMINGEQKIKFGGVGNSEEAAMKTATNWANNHGYEREVQAGKVKVVRDQQGVAEDWQKVNRHDKTDGLSKKAVSAYRREHPGSKLKTAVTTKPSKLKKGSKSAKRRASFCARMSGMKKHRTGAKTKRDPDSNINKALRRWHCESIEEMQELIMIGEQYISKLKEDGSAGGTSSGSIASVSMPLGGKKKKKGGGVNLLGGPVFKR